MKALAILLLILNIVYTFILCAIFLTHPHKVTGFMGVCSGIYGGLLVAIGATILENPNKKDFEQSTYQNLTILDSPNTTNYLLKGQGICLILLGSIFLIFCMWSIKNLETISIFFGGTMGGNLLAYFLNYKIYNDNNE